MKVLIFTAALVAVAVAGPTYRQVDAGIAGPAPVVYEPVHLEPAFVQQPAHVGPALVDTDSYQPVIIGPALVDTEQYQPIEIGPAFVESDSYQPVEIGPALVDSDSYEPVEIGPAFVDSDSYQPVEIGPALVDSDSYEPIEIGPAMVDELGPIGSAASGAPLVQIVININKDGQLVGTPEVVQTPSIVPEIVEIKPTPVIVVENEQDKPINDIDALPVEVVEVAPSPVEVVEAPPAIIGTPVLPTLPVIVKPDALN